MNSLQLLNYLKQNNLLREASAASSRLSRIFTECLMAEHEDVLIVTDFGKGPNTLSPILGAGYYLAARSLGLEPVLVAQQSRNKGERAEEHVEQALEDSGLENIVIITDFIGSTPRIGKSFRKQMSSRNHKYISCTGISSLSREFLPQVLKAMDTDYTELRRRSLLLEKALDSATEARLVTPAGTDLTFQVGGKKARLNDGRFNLPGKGGNMPAGEVYIAPRKKGVEGKLVIDGSSRNIWGTALVEKPITLKVRNGEVAEVEGGREARLLEKSIEWAHDNSKHPWGIRRVSELGIGINPDARIIGATIIDEKSAGTAHVAIGSNHWFGGTVYSIIHLDQVVRNASIRLDGKPLDRGLYA